MARRGAMNIYMRTHRLAERAAKSNGRLIAAIVTGFSGRCQRPQRNGEADAAESPVPPAVVLMIGRPFSPAMLSTRGSDEIASSLDVGPVPNLRLSAILGGKAN